jgi:hypothetical protein
MSTNETTPDPDLVASRARSLTPEEQEAGIADARLLAGAVLAESEARTVEPEGTEVERRRSEETVDQTD